MQVTNWLGVVVWVMVLVAVITCFMVLHRLEKRDRP